MIITKNAFIEMIHKTKCLKSCLAKFGLATEFIWTSRLGSAPGGPVSCRLMRFRQVSMDASTAARLQRGSCEEGAVTTRCGGAVVFSSYLPISLPCQIS